jgi:hypothetical protein
MPKFSPCIQTVVMYIESIFTIFFIRAMVKGQGHGLNSIKENGPVKI